jgi:hypothetical protein
VLDQFKGSLDKVLPAQRQCNFLGLWVNNFADISSFSFGNGPPFSLFSFSQLGAQGEAFQRDRPSSNVGINYLPNNNDNECESGNEPHDGSSQHLGRPPGLQSKIVPLTAAPAQATQRARAAGLLNDRGTTP